MATIGSKATEPTVSVRGPKVDMPKLNEEPLELVRKLPTLWSGPKIARRFSAAIHHSRE
jgi:hypothetical protein